MLKIQHKIYLSWDDVNQLVDELCTKIQSSYLPINSIFGLKRGGLIPAVMISHKLNIPWSDVILPNTLVIDDICDSGLTLQKCVASYTAVLHYKPHTSCFEPTLYSSIHEGDEWVIYPWERKDSEQIQDYLKK